MVVDADVADAVPVRDNMSTIKRLTLLLLLLFAIAVVVVVELKRRRRRRNLNIQQSVG